MVTMTSPAELQAIRERDAPAKPVSSSPTYRCWSAMRWRCKHPSYKGNHRYAGRGIKVCERWDKFANFLADMGEMPAGLTLDRINNDGDYEPGNCRWATQKEQSNNKLIHKLDIVGKRFGKLLVTSYSHIHKKGTYWHCICDCGNTTTKRGNNLTRGNAKSCGCFHNAARARNAVKARAAILRRLGGQTT